MAPGVKKAAVKGNRASPVRKAPPKGKGKGKASTQSRSNKDWTCSKCKEYNFGRNAQCRRCGSAKVQEVDALCKGAPWR